MKYVLPDLPYKISALEPHYSAELLELHHGKHHAGYVKGANATLDKLAEARESSDYSAINQLQKNLAFNLSGHIMHSVFWTSMSPDGGGSPADELAEQVSQDFGSADALREQMTEVATSLQGSGWVSLSWEPLGDRLIVEQVYDHQGNTGSATVPLLVIDCWEHAYYLQYKNEKGKWLKGFWEMVNWSEAGSRLAKARSADVL